jgi:dihydropyrimidine dehydrogenase (NAD+) subunit PreT
MMPLLRELLQGGRAEQRLGDHKPVYSTAEAQAEANRCLYCVDAPCIKACPTSIDIPTFIKKIASGNIRGSARTIFEKNILGYSCARVCPVEVLCVGSCVYTGWHRDPIAIGRLQRYATETATRDGQPRLFTPNVAEGESPRIRVALIGAGPASLACAAELALRGHHAVIFEKRALPGGLNTTGIAPYKLHADDALHEVEWVAALGVEIRTGVEFGRDLKGADLIDEYDAVFVGVGLGSDSKLGIAGEDGPGVYGATAWIEAMKLARNQDLALGSVVVVGGGNTAIDMARECSQLGAKEVVMVYRRGLGEMSGYAHELDLAKREGVRLITETVPVGFVRRQDGRVSALRVAKSHAGKALPGTEFEIPCETVGIAIGQSKIRAIAGELAGIRLDRRGCIVADPATGATDHPKVWSGGDCVNGGKEVVHAVADGRNAALEMMRRLGGGA